jgi:hypothetical protein
VGSFASIRTTEVRHWSAALPAKNMSETEQLRAWKRDPRRFVHEVRVGRVLWVDSRDWIDTIASGA